MKCPQGLGELITQLERGAQLQRIVSRIDPCLEIAELTDRVCKGAASGRALFFENVVGSSFPVVTNIFGSVRRMEMALGVKRLDDFRLRLERDLGSMSANEAQGAMIELLGQKQYAPREEAKARWQELNRPCDFTLLPALTCWPKEPGPYLNLGQVYSRDPQSGELNCGLYRIQVLSRASGAIRLNPGAGLLRHLEASRNLGRDLPVAVALGGPPACLLAACASLPTQVNELHFAAWLQGEPVEITPSPRHRLPVPSNAEIVLEGSISVTQSVTEGPFGNHSGFYREAGDCPLFRLEGFFHRQGALYPSTLVGPPPMENAYLGKALERIELARLRYDHPAILDLNMPLEGIYHRCALVRIDPEKTHSHSLLRLLLENGPLRGSRLIVLVAEEVNVQEPSTLFWSALNRCDPRRDFLLSGRSLGIDATGRGQLPEGAAAPLNKDPRTVRRIEKILISEGMLP